MDRAIAAVAITGVLTLTACTQTGRMGTNAPATPAASAVSPEASAPIDTAPPTVPATSLGPTTSPEPSASPRAGKKPHPISTEALSQKRYDGGRLRLGRLLLDAGPYKKYLVTYTSDGLRISGVMLVPDGKGPHPVVVLNHGYIDRRTYFPGQGMPREHDYLARRGYVVFHTDYRGHATSDDDPDIDYELRLPYSVDTINAVYAVKRSKLGFLDRDRVGWLGRSMGGNVTLTALAVQPGLVDAAVIYASVSSMTADNWRQFNRGSDDRQAVNRRIDRSFGLPDDNPSFWRAASSRPYFDRVTEPVLVHHGTADDTCPIVWSERTVRALERAGKDVTFYRYPGAGHTFEGAVWQRSMRRTVAFFDRHLS